MKNLIHFFLLLGFLALLSACSKEDLSRSGSEGAFADAASDLKNVVSGSGDSTFVVPSGQITAGEWNDLDHWDFWNDLMLNDTFFGYQAHWQFFPENRYAVQVKNNLGQPVPDCLVQLKGLGGSVIWEGRSDNFGQATLWAGMFSSDFQATQIFVQSTTSFATLDNPESFELGTNQVVLNGFGSIPTAVDVAFIVDATGSMGDEITYLQAELTDVLQRIQNFNNGLDLRSASVFYRDEGDDYVTKKSPFTSDFSLTQNFVNSNEAGGGGDFPEAVHSAVSVAINELEWSDQAVARIAFLILDAPPHHESVIIRTLQDDIRKAAAKGIKIIPVTASGIDRETEFLMRYFALATNSTYVFITDHSGIGNAHLTPTVGEYEVEFLNDLMVRLVKKYVAM